jgi:hypothetical protein
LNACEDQLKIHLSTATIIAYENRQKLMNLHFHPIVFFENAWKFHNYQLKNLEWQVRAEPIGSHRFAVEISSHSPFNRKNNENYIEFHLSKMNVPFHHDNYPCEMRFTATLDSSNASSSLVDCSFWGIVKTVWSHGLQ